MKSYLLLPLAVAVLVTTFVVSGVDRAEAQSSTSCSQRYSQVWEMPLRASDVGQSLSTVFSRSEFSTVIRPRGDLRRMEIGRAPDGTVALQMNIPKGENKTTEFFLSPLGNKGVDAACLSLRVFMEPGFQWPLNGGGSKMGWGLWGGYEASKVSGGTPPNEQLGWSVRNVNTVWGFRHYSYHLNRQSQWGQQGSPLARWDTSAWQSGRWHTIDLEVVMNTPGNANGYLQLWLDGGNRKTATGLMFRRNSDWAIRGLMFSDIWGGKTSDPKNWSPKAQKMWYADYKLFTASGGVVSKPASTPPPSPTDTSSEPSTPIISSGPFAAVAPSGTIGPNNVTLQWRPDPDADRYYVRVLTKRDKWADRRTVFGGSAFTSRNCNGSSCSLSIGSLPPDEYEWMVRSQRGTTILLPYSTLAFRVSNSADQSTQLVSSTSSSEATNETSTSQSSTSTSNGGSFAAIAPSGTIDRNNVTLQWRPDPNADRYYVRVLTRRDKWADRRTAFGGSAFTSRNCNGSSCSLNIGSLPPDQYEWMVRSQRGTTILLPYSTLAFEAR